MVLAPKKFHSAGTIAEHRYCDGISAERPLTRRPAPDCRRRRSSAPGSPDVSVQSRRYSGAAEEAGLQERYAVAHVYRLKWLRIGKAVHPSADQSAQLDGSLFRISEVDDGTIRGGCGGVLRHRIRRARGWAGTIGAPARYWRRHIRGSCGGAIDRTSRERHGSSRDRRLTRAQQGPLLATTHGPSLLGLIPARVE